MKRLIFLLIIISIVIFATYSKLPSQETVNELSDWKVYRSEKDGYEFKYPQNWKIDDATIEGFKKINILPPPPDNTPAIVITIYHSDVSFEDWVEKRINQLKKYFKGDFQPLQEITINGQKALRTQVFPYGAIRIWISKNSHIFEIEGPQLRSQLKFIDEFETLVNTFQFTE